MSEKKVFGIDLGTTYSCIAHVDETGRAVVINNSTGKPTTPSVVYFESADNVEVGEVAKETALLEPDKTASLFKPLMGKSGSALDLDGKDITPQEVSALVLKKLAKDASELVDAEVVDVVITVPAYFGEVAKEATIAAGELAGFNVLSLLDEPIAAAFAYGLNRVSDSKTILVYDLGGGTFDVSVMRIEPDKLDVICTTGNSTLGGKNWDDEISKYVLGETAFKGTLSNQETQDLRQKAEKAKQMLTGKKQSTNIGINLGGSMHSIALDITTFNNITSPLLKETLHLTDEAIKIAEEKGYKIDEIVLVGGSTKMNQVEEALSEKYKLPIRKTDVDFCVAQGAAIYASEFGKNPKPTPGGSESEPVEIGGRILTVATRKSLAIKCIVNGEEKCMNMIIAHTPMPGGHFSVTQKFVTASANMNAAPLVVYETEITDEYFDVGNNKPLGEAVLELTGDLPAGAPLEVTFSLRQDGKLDVHGKDLTKGQEIKAELQAQKGHTLSSEEFDEKKKQIEGITVMD